MLEVRRVKTAELDSALASLFNDPGSKESVHQQVDSFKKMAKRENYDLTRQFVVTENDQVIYSCCYLPGAADSATVFSSNPTGLDNAQQIRAIRALRQLRRWAQHKGSHFLQMYLETDDKARRDIALRCGFNYLTDLKYLYRMNDIGVPIIKGPKLNWVKYDGNNDELFKDVLAQTYIDSTDCPELNDVRDMDKTLQGHKAAGKFLPELWQIAYLDNQPIGVLLLSALADGQTMELTYIGITPAARGQGLSKIMLAEAIRIANRMGCYMTVAVDKRNKPARALYKKMGFKSLFDRAILYYSSKN